MKKLFIPVLFAMLLSACSSTGAAAGSSPNFDPASNPGSDQNLPAAQTKDYPIALRIWNPNYQ
jgi:hypothetical protein